MQDVQCTLTCGPTLPRTFHRRVYGRRRIDYWFLEGVARKRSSVHSVRDTTHTHTSSRTQYRRRPGHPSFVIFVGRGRTRGQCPSTITETGTGGSGGGKSQRMRTARNESFRDDVDDASDDGDELVRLRGGSGRAHFLGLLGWYHRVSNDMGTKQREHSGTFSEPRRCLSIPRYFTRCGRTCSTRGTDRVSPRMMSELLQRVDRSGAVLQAELERVTGAWRHTARRGGHHLRSLACLRALERAGTF